jgi:hypothetical protein
MLPKAKVKQIDFQLITEFENKSDPEDVAKFNIHQMMTEKGLMKEFSKVSELVSPLDTEKYLPTYLLGDPDRFQQVTINMI